MDMQMKSNTKFAKNKGDKPLVDNTLLEEKEWQQQYYEHLDNY